MKGKKKYYRLQNNHNNSAARTQKVLRHCSLNKVRDFVFFVKKNKDIEQRWINEKLQNKQGMTA